MKIEKVIEELSKQTDSLKAMEFIFDLPFDARFNALREVIYHVDICLAERNYENAKKFLDIAEKLNIYLEVGHKFNKPEDKKNTRTLKIIAKKKLAKYYEALGENQMAIKQYLVILDDLQTPEDDTFIAEILMEIGIIEEQIGKKREAIAKFERSSKIYRAKNDDFNYEAALFNSAHVLYDLNQYSLAEAYCQKVIDHYRQTNKMQSPVAHSFLEMANIFEIKKKDRRARSYYEDALIAYRQINDRTKISDILNRIGSYEMDEEKYTSAATLFHEALDLKRTLDFQQGKANLCLMRAEALRSAGDLEKALDYYYLAYYYYNEVGLESKKLIIKHKIFKCLKGLSRMDKDMGTYIEKFHAEYANTSIVENVERIDYREHYSEGAKLSDHKSWPYSEKPKVNRKFLIYLLRNLSRVYLKLGREKDYLKFLDLKNTVEQSYQKESK